MNDSLCNLIKAWNFKYYVVEGLNRNYTVNLSYLSYFTFIKFTNGYYTFVNQVKKAQGYYLHPVISFLNGSKFRSTTVVRTHSYVPNILPIPKVIIIRKNITLHNCFTSMVDIASVNAMNTKPGPWATYRFFRKMLKI